MADETEEPKGSLRKALESAAPQLESAAPQLFGGIVTYATGNPILGAATSVGVREALDSKFAERLIRRVRVRLGLFADATQDALPPGFDFNTQNPHFDDAVFQNYRRAMDAIDEAVIPALGRLAAAYYDQPADSFFRGVGRVLEDLSAAEFGVLCKLVSATVELDEDLVKVSARHHEGTFEAHLQKYAPPYPTVPATQTWKVDLPWDAVHRCLWLLNRNALLLGDHTFKRDTAQRLQTIIGAVSVDLLPVRAVD